MSQKRLDALIVMIQSGDEELIDLAVERLKNGSTSVTPPKPRKRRAFWQESMREETGKLRTKGWSYARIGRKLGLSANTVRKNLGKREP